jgi:hypothetical protein
MNSSSGTLGGGDFHPVLLKLSKDARPGQDRAICQTESSQTYLQISAYGILEELMEMVISIGFIPKL